MSIERRLRIHVIASSDEKHEVKGREDREVARR